MNFVFLSPNFPKTYYNFTKGLRNNGVTTLGIGDEPYDQLSQELKDSLVEYYKVNSVSCSLQAYPQWLSYPSRLFSVFIQTYKHMCNLGVFWFFSLRKKGYLFLCSPLLLIRTFYNLLLFLYL